MSLSADVKFKKDSPYCYFIIKSLIVHKSRSKFINLSNGVDRVSNRKNILASDNFPGIFHTRKPMHKLASLIHSPYTFWWLLSTHVRSNIGDALYIIFAIRNFAVIT